MRRLNGWEQWERLYDLGGVEIHARYHPDRATVVVSAKVKPFAMGVVVLEHEFSQFLVREHERHLWPVASVVLRHNAIEANLRTRPPLGVGLIAEVCVRCWTDSTVSDFKGPRLCLQCWTAEQKVDPVLDEAINAALAEGFDP